MQEQLRQFIVRYHAVHRVQRDEQNERRRISELRKCFIGRAQDGECGPKSVGARVR
jgi:hypothetical protein